MSLLVLSLDTLELMIVLLQPSIDIGIVDIYSENASVPRPPIVLADITESVRNAMNNPGCVFLLLDLNEQPTTLHLLIAINQAPYVLLNRNSQLEILTSSHVDALIPALFCELENQQFVKNIDLVSR